MATRLRCVPGVMAVASRLAGAARQAARRRGAAPSCGISSAPSSSQPSRAAVASFGV